jgi:carbonic anhydrase
MSGDEDHDHDHGRVHERLDEQVAARERWARRRREGIPTDERLLVVACMDERIPVEDALGLELGDAQIYRNAGGKVTDDLIRSAALTTQFFDTEEIVVVNHTDCGMMSAGGEAMAEGLTAAAGGDLDDVDLDPGLPGLDIGDASLAEWLRPTADIDEACAAQVRLLDEHPLVDAEVHGYVYEVESGELRHPGGRVAEAISERVAE